MKRGKRLISFLTAALLAVMMILPVSASETGNDVSDAVNAARKGVLQINLVYVEQNGKEHVIQGGSGFLIGATNGAEYMITNYHVIAMNDEIKTEASTHFGVDFFNPNSVNLQIQVVVKRDVVINASVVNSSDNMDFVILKLEQPIYDRESLVIDDNDDHIVETMDVYALGFPAAIEFVEDTSFYTSEDVNITNGIVSKKATVDGIKYIRHSATMSEGNSGGPLVNRQGQVVGINTAGVDDTYFYSLQASELTSVLNALGITYRKAEDEDPAILPTETVTETETESRGGGGFVEQPVDKTSLELAIEMARDIERDGYTDESLQKLDQAISAARNVMDNAGATQNEVDAAEGTLTDARQGLEKKSGPNIMLIIAVIAVVIIVIIIAIVVILLSSGKKKKPAVASGQPVAPQIPPVAPAPRPSQQTAPQQPVRPTPQNYVNFGPSEGSGETSVLSQGSDETSVLGAGAAIVSAMLTRKKNNENIQINKQLFKIGKERVKVDYCIPDNTSISRVHAQIIFKNNAYYIMDMKSTNYTYVNGNKVVPEQEMKLNSGDKIRLADEEFEFRC